MVALALGARRRRIPFDPRVLVGILLVVGSVGGVVAVVKVTNRTEPVYVAAQTLVPGTPLTTQSLDVRWMRLGDSSEHYLTELPRDGAVVTRSVAAGELVPLSALGAATSVTDASVVVPLSTKPAASIGPGSVIDLWAAAKASGTAAGTGEKADPPHVLVSGATVVRLLTPSGLLAADRSATLEVEVPREDVAAVLQAVADGESVSAVALGAAVQR
jgi:hypothetical protein